MTFQPVIPTGGLTGWSFLKRTKSAQQDLQQASPVLKRDQDYFRARIGQIKTADELVDDRRLLRFTLTAFGLEGDVENKAFIRKVLSDGTLKADALSNRLADKRYRDLSAAFGFGDFPVSRNQLSDFADKLVAQHRSRAFEAAIGTVDNSYRLAMNAEREIPLLAAKSMSEDAKWFTVMGNKPLREVLQTALGLPSSLASLDIDQQLSVFKSRARSAFGETSVKQFLEPDRMEKLIRTFLVRNELSAGPNAASSSASAALQLLSSVRR